MNVTVLDRNPDRATQPERSAQSHLGFIDCDVHPYVKSAEDFDPFLSKRWQEHRRTIGNRSRQGLGKMPMYPRISPGVRYAHGQLAKERRHSWFRSADDARTVA